MKLKCLHNVIEEDGLYLLGKRECIREYALNGTKAIEIVSVINDFTTRCNISYLVTSG